ncbi:uncharacterized protein PHA67_018236 [Liasis olivaceus]
MAPKKVQSKHGGKKKVQSGNEGDKNVQNGNEGDKNVQSNNEGNKKVQSKNGKKKVLKKITIESKKEIVEKHECGIRVTDLASEYKMAKSTISNILKNKDAIEGADVAKGGTMLTKQRTQVLEEVEKLLLVWLNEKQLAGDSVSEAMICEKARKSHSDLLQKNPSTSATSEEFKASSGWFDKFCKRSGIHSEIVSMCKNMGLDVDGADIEELVEDHEEELTTEELAELQSEQQKMLVEEHSTEEEEDTEEVSSDVIKSIMEKWNECQDFFEKHHPNITVMNRVLNLMNDNVVSYFWRVMQRRKKQVTLDRFFAKTEPAAKRQRREETPEGDLPNVLKQG